MKNWTNTKRKTLIVLARFQWKNEKDCLCIISCTSKTFLQDLLYTVRKIKNTWCDTKQPNKSALSRPVTIKKYDPEFLWNNRGFDAYRPLVAWLIDIWIDILNGKPGCVTRCQPGGVMHLSISAGHAPCHTVTCHTVTLWDIIRVKWLSMMHTCNQRNPENQG